LIPLIPSMVGKGMSKIPIWVKGMVEPAKAALAPAKGPIGLCIGCCNASLNECSRDSTPGQRGYGCLLV
jgi:hypothetical protein